MNSVAHSETPGEPDRRAVIAEAAANWVIRRERGLNDSETTAFLEWLRSDPAHAAEFKRIDTSWGKVSQLESDPGLEAMVFAVEKRAQRRKQTRWIGASALLVSAAAAIVLVFFVLQAPDARLANKKASNDAHESYQVLSPTAKRMTLPDGSVAELNAGSELDVAFTDSVRHVTLLRGEAHFTVTKNKARPFLVSAANVDVRAVGTAFAVRLGSASVDVLVTEGKIRLEPAAVANSSGNLAPSLSDDAAAPVLGVGQHASIDTSAAQARIQELSSTTPAEIDQSLAWMSTRLVFNQTPLSDVVAAFNRYNSHQLQLGQPELAQRTLTGVFRADNLDGFLRLAKASVDVRPDRRSDTLTVLLPAE